jgi:mono/diheme cytochrome c family protein
MRRGFPITACFIALSHRFTMIAAALVTLIVAASLVAPARGAEADPRQTPPKQPLVEGRQVFEAKGCVHCHSVGGVAGVAQIGPDLARTGSWSDAMQFSGSLWNHTPAMSAKMHELGVQRTAISPDEMAKLVAYLFAARFFDEPGNAARGREAFEERLCSHCHQLAGRGGTVGPRLDELAEVMSSSFMAEALWSHGPEMAAKMAELKLTRPTLEGDDVANIVAYIRGDARGTAALDLTFVQAGSPQAGMSIFREKGCIHCHAIAGAGGTVGPDLGMLRPQAHVADMAAALWNHGPAMWAKMKERGRPVPKLNDAEMADLLAYLYFVQYLGQSGNATRGSLLFREKSCSGCHAAGGEGTKATADLAKSDAVRSPFSWASAMWNHPSAMEKKAAVSPSPWPQFADDEMRDLVEFLRSHGAKK